MAKDILQEIVRGMFLNSRDHLEVVREIARHARRAAEVVQRRDFAGLAAAVAHSWDLNQRLDAGTNPPAVAAILDSSRATGCWRPSCWARAGAVTS